MDLEIAVPVPKHTTYTYEWDEPIPAGTRVMVPFGGRKLVGVVLGKAPDLASPRSFAVKKISEIIDENPVYDAALMELGRWLSRYYMYPLGEVLRVMMPAGARKTTRRFYALTKVHPKKNNLALSAAQVALSNLAEEFRELWVESYGNSSITAARFERIIKLCLAGRDSSDDKAVLSPAQLRNHLIEQGFVKVSSQSQVEVRRTQKKDDVSKNWLQEGMQDQAKEILPAHKLNQAQMLAVETVFQKGILASAQRPFLLRGVTGSGKTEVYMHIISKTLEADASAQVLVLVPEIALTPQMTSVFAARFPGKVAVVHSAMLDRDRWQQLEKIRSGERSILIGPRSAVFGPFKHLRLLVVDEEHDQSYKQASGLTYHGRDVAVVRARLEKAAVLLGSATPSLESYHNAKSGRYELIELAERVGGRPLPQARIVSHKPSFTKGALLGKDLEKSFSSAEEAAGTIAPDILSAIQENLMRGFQTIVLVNRRGFAHFVLNVDDDHAILCPQCSISMTLHRRSRELRCHYCDFKQTLAAVLHEHQGRPLVAVGLGSEKLEQHIRSAYPAARVSRLDSDIVTTRETLERELEAFRSGATDIMVGTQILAKGHDFPRVTLICMLEIDKLLDFPDFRAAEKTFQLIVQAAGRAGRAEHAGEVMLQTYRRDHPVIVRALTQDYLAFAETELAFRKQLNYPPFRRLILAELTGSDLNQMDASCERMQFWMEQMFAAKPELRQTVSVLGPAAPAIEKIRNRHRRTVIFMSANTQVLWSLVAAFSKTFSDLGGDLRLKVDVDAQNLI